MILNMIAKHVVKQLEKSDEVRWTINKVTSRETQAVIDRMFQSYFGRYSFETRVDRKVEDLVLKRIDKAVSDALEREIQRRDLIALLVNKINANQLGSRNEQ